MKRRLVAVAALALLAGCAAEEPTEITTGYGEQTAEEEATVAADPEETTEEPSESATPTGSGLVELTVGDTFTTDRGSTITVHEVRVDIPYEFESDAGGAWHAIDTEYCLGDPAPDQAAFEDFQFAWILRTEEGYNLDYPSSSWDDIATPALDLYGVTPVAGECHRGWVLIDGPTGTTVTEARLDNVSWAL